MAFSKHTAKTYERKCDRGHGYDTGDAAARWTTRKGGARYWCPKCLEAGHRPPKDWKKA